MNDHSELVKEARELADNWSVHQYTRISTTLFTLADIVEAYGKAESEAVAACQTCNEAIKEHLDAMDHVDEAMGLDTCEGRIELRAARHLAKRAAENYDKLKGGG